MSHIDVELRDILTSYRNAREADPGDAVRQLKTAFEGAGYITGPEFFKRFVQDQDALHVGKVANNQFYLSRAAARHASGFEDGDAS